MHPCERSGYGRTVGPSAVTGPWPGMALNLAHLGRSQSQMRANMSGRVGISGTGARWLNIGERQRASKRASERERVGERERERDRGSSFLCSEEDSCLRIHPICWALRHPAPQHRQHHIESWPPRVHRVVRPVVETSRRRRRRRRRRRAGPGPRPRPHPRPRGAVCSAVPTATPSQQASEAR